MTETAYPGDDLRFRTDRWSNPFRVVLARLRERLAVHLATVDLADGRLLDFGAADTPYRDLVPRSTEYLVADLPGNPRADVVVTADGTIPDVPDGAVDVVLSTQVLEHVASPTIYLAECARVMRPGGTLLLSTHGIMPYHPVPTDFWRWTHDGLRRVVTQAGLEVVRMEGIMALLPASMQLFQEASKRRVPRRLRPAYVAAIQRTIDAVDRRQRDAARDRDALVVICVARRPGGDAAGTGAS